MTRASRIIGRLIAVLALATMATAATPIPHESVRGIMMLQAIEVVGGNLVDCDGLPFTNQEFAAEVSCARVPLGMYRHVRVAIHGRLYEYLERGTLEVGSDWDLEREDQRVEYLVDGGVLIIDRQQHQGAAYVVFRFRSR